LHCRDSTSLLHCNRTILFESTDVRFTFVHPPTTTTMSSLGKPLKSSRYEAYSLLPQRDQSIRLNSATHLSSTLAMDCKCGIIKNCFCGYYLNANHSAMQALLDPGQKVLHKRTFYFFIVILLKIVVAFIFRNLSKEWKSLAVEGRERLSNIAAGLDGALYLLFLILSLSWIFCALKVIFCSRPEDLEAGNHSQ
jgi:hypothetical protein